jgi:predicted flap endonuclease-1-like 5' DNA nuclease
MYGHFNPFEQTGAWWQHLLMLVVAAVLGYIIGYITKKSEVENLESKLSLLDAAVDDFYKTKEVVAVSPIPVAIENKLPEPAVERNAPVVVPTVAPVIPDDLKLVEGIGSKIEQLLNNEGIFTFAQLASTSPERIKEILVAAGSRFQMHDPFTWPEQSALARDGKLEELKTWQNELKKGRKE